MTVGQLPSPLTESEIASLLGDTENWITSPDQVVSVPGASVLEAYQKRR
jgi:hypothetical protein